MAPQSRLSAPRPRNGLLAKLPESEYARLAPNLKPVPLNFNVVLYEARSRIEHVYFPNTGAVSALTVMEDGNAIEVATIGNEGMVGLPVFIGAGYSPNKVLVQVAGEGLRLGAAELMDEVARGGQLGKLLDLYHAAFMVQVSQSVACNGLHSIKQRCCRWLLITHDRVESDSVALTQEFLAIMLGVRRPSVTDVLKSLRDEGMVNNVRGAIEILDRKGLEATSCECYRIVRAEFKRLMEV